MASALFKAKKDILEPMREQKVASSSMELLDNSGNVPRIDSNAVHYHPMLLKFSASSVERKSNARSRRGIMAAWRNADTDECSVATRKRTNYLGLLALSTQSSKTESSNIACAVGILSCFTSPKETVALGEEPTDFFNGRARLSAVWAGSAQHWNVMRLQTTQCDGVFASVQWDECTLRQSLRSQTSGHRRKLYPYWCAFARCVRQRSRYDRWLVQRYMKVWLRFKICSQTRPGAAAFACFAFSTSSIC